MAYILTHYFEGGTESQYRTVLEIVHPGGKLPPGQTFHAAGATDSGWLVMTVWESKESSDSFVQGTLVPALKGVDGGFAGPPEERTAELANLVAL